MTHKHVGVADMELQFGKDARWTCVQRLVILWVDTITVPQVTGRSLTIKKEYISLAPR